MEPQTHIMYNEQTVSYRSIDYKQIAHLFCEVFFGV